MDFRNILTKFAAKFTITHKMKRIFLPITLMLAGVMMLASCLGDDSDSSDIVYYGDGAITSFSLGTLNKYYLYNNGDTIKKTTDGTDSTTTVDCSSVKMTIDQLAYAKDKDGNLTKCHPIFNTDSLPAGTDISKVVTTVNSKNSGVVTLLRLKKNATDKDTLDYYSSSDSIDFTTPREFRVFSTDGTYYRRYLVTLNVHKEQPDSFVWHRQSMENIVSTETNIAAAKTVTAGNSIFTIFSNGSNSCFIGKSITDDSQNWYVTGSDMNMVFKPEAYKNVASLDGWVYLLNQGTLFRAEDAHTWQTVASNLNDKNIKQLIGAANGKLYALTTSGIASSKDGVEWQEASLDGDKDLLPVENLNICELPLKTNSDVKRIVIIGSNPNNGGNAVVWSKLEDSSEQTDSYSWSLYEGVDKYALPDMKGLSVMYYDGKLYAIGGEGQNGSSATAYSKIYCSTDQALTWHSSSMFSLPDGFSKDTEAAAVNMVADKYNHVWLVSVKDGKAWKMRINRLGWKEEQKAFNK